MDDGLYLTIPSHLLFPCPEIFSHGLDEFLRNTTACTHTHTCNSPSSDATHTHTCLHKHTHVMDSGEDDVEQDQLRNPSRKPLGNREAVRKYRQKKKAHVAFLEEEIKKLRAANQQLLRMLQGHAALEAEVVRLSTLLLDVRGKIDAEIGGILLHDEPPAPCFGTDARAAVVRREDCEIDESGIVSGELGAPEMADSMDAVASFVNSAA
ncbi:hypothetical protein ACQ4PT_068495 [Festuca glaucescens]